MADDLIKRLATEQRKRLVASLLSSAEQSPWWSRLRAEEQREYRNKVLASIGVYHDFMLDVIKVGNENTIINEHAITMIQAVHDSQRRLEAAARRNSG